METSHTILLQEFYTRFLPYLWGMETRENHTKQSLKIRSYRTYEEWKPSKYIDIILSGPVLTVPMRNGNSLRAKRLGTGKLRSYRTYEEWKPESKPSISKILSSSYRTYEEWKLHIRRNELVRRFKFLPYLWGMETDLHIGSEAFDVGSYRTYEEWKPRIVDDDELNRIMFLPYLWGMETHSCRRFFSYPWK